MLIDGLTKALQGLTFNNFVSQLGLVDISEHLEESLDTLSNLDDQILDDFEHCFGNE